MFTRAILDYFSFVDSAGQPQPTARGVRLPLGEEHVCVDVIRDDIVRLAISRQGRLADRPTPAVCAELPEPPSFSLITRPDAVSLSTRDLEVHIRRDTFSIRITRQDGSSVLRSAGGSGGASRAYGVLNDAFIVSHERKQDDVILGLGEKTGTLDRNGRRFLLWNTDVLGMDDEELVRHWPFDRDGLKDPTDTTFDPYYISIPFYCRLDADSGAACGHFIDNSHPAYFDFGQAGVSHAHFAGGAYVAYVFAGPALADVVEAFTWLTGRISPPPLWALGHHQCRWKGYDERAFIAIAESYRSKEIPCDGLWLDIEHMEDYRILTWAAKRFPAPRAMLASLKAKGFRVVTIVDPGVKEDPGYSLFEQGRQDGHFCLTAGGEIYTGQVWPGRTVFPDFAKVDARVWWASLIRDWAAEGVAGAWIDMNEPSTGRIDSAPMLFDGGRVPHESHHNLYARLMAEATVDGLKQARPKERPFVLSRAGSPGIQRFAANWLGDNCSRWDHLRMSMPMAMGLGLSGQPFVGADIGGFAEAADGELLARWAQLGALSPFFRNHNCDEADQYPWSFGRRWEEIYRQAVRLRYRLMPYIYTAFLESAETGAPVQRPLVFDFQHDRETWTIEDEFMLGNHLLVAPVCQASAKVRQVYFPEATWHDWHTGERWEGPQSRLVAAPLERIPLFVRGGAVICLWPEPPPTTMDHHPWVIELAVFIPGEDGETVSLLEEDDGVSLARMSGAFRRTAFTLRRRGRALTIEARVSGSGYPEGRRSRFRIAFHGPAVTNVCLDGRPLPRRDGALQWEDGATGFDLSATVESGS